MAQNPSNPQLPFKTLETPSKRDLEAVNSLGQLPALRSDPFGVHVPT